MKKNYDLLDLGWNEGFQNEYDMFKENYEVGRVSVEYKNLYRIYTQNGEVYGTISGKMIYNAETREDYPAVGDWVVLSPGEDGDKRIIQGILNRKSKFVRKYAGKSRDEQIIAANIDTAFICMSLNQNFNLRRLERYITMAWDSGAFPVILLTKADLCDNISELLMETQNSAPGIDIISVSSFLKTGIEELRKYIKKGNTVAFIGSSGVGKSTIINELLGEYRQTTKEISESEDRGRHTTTNRELMLLPGGGILIDTPGMRELHITDVKDSIDTTFLDIETLAAECRFPDCRHDSEPGCAVKKAIEQGVLHQERYQSYIKLKKESEFMERKTNAKAKSEYKKMLKKRNKLNRIKNVK